MPSGSLKKITVEILANGYTGLTTENIKKALDYYFGSPELNVSFSVKEIAKEDEGITKTI